MDHNQARTSRDQVSYWKASLAGGAAVLLAVLAWVYFQQLALAPWRATSAAGLFLVQALVVFSLERALALAARPRRWRYHLAFSAGVVLLAAQSLLDAGVHAWLPVQARALHLPFTAYLLPLVLTGCAGSFFGGLLASSAAEGLWENNYPPAERIQAEVFAYHQAALGPLPSAPWPKRAFDLLLAGVGLILSGPLWMTAGLLIWFEDPGPIFFVKNSVGKGGVNFLQFKFRTMVLGAEEQTGPVLAKERDERILFIGRFLRKTALDELPQLINILKGEMSLVGPRPQRTVLVHSYLETLPEYAERHRVLPGLAGLAQVAGDYYLTPRQKLRFDRIYIRYQGLGFDLKLICLACLITSWYRWQRDWNGRLPRRLMRLGSHLK